MDPCCRFLLKCANYEIQSHVYFLKGKHHNIAFDPSHRSACCSSNTSNQGVKVQYPLNTAMQSCLVDWLAFSFFPESTFNNQVPGGDFIIK